MKKQTWVLAPFRWAGMAVILTPLAAIGMIATLFIGAYCLIRWKDPRDLH